MSDRVAVMRDGGIEQLGTPAELYENPATRYVAEFIGESNSIDGVVADRVDGEHYRFRTADGRNLFCGSSAVALEIGAGVTCVLRPEKVSLGIDGQPQENVCGGTVREHIYAPAGMSSTGSDPEDASIPGLAIGYTKKGPNGPLTEPIPNTASLPYRGTPAGGGYSTVEDLLRFATALQQNKLLNARYTELLTTGKVPTPMGSSYAYGFGDRTFNGTRCFGHNGGAPGMNGELEICPAAGYVVTALANIDPLSAEHITEFVLNRLPAK